MDLRAAVSLFDFLVEHRAMQEKTRKNLFPPVNLQILSAINTEDREVTKIHERHVEEANKSIPKELLEPS